jgi:myosin-5
MQKNLLRNMYRKRYLLIRNGMIKCQAHIRGVLARKRAEKLRQERAAILIQSQWRGFAARSKYWATRKQIIHLQSCARGFLIRRNYRSIREERAATTIQSVWRGSVDRRKYLRTRDKVVLAQCCIRRYLARKQLKGLRDEARSISHIKEVSYRLENKVIELTQNLNKRTQENKNLLGQLALMESQLLSWQERHSTLEERASGLEQDAVKANDAIARTIILEDELKSLQNRYDDTQRNLDQMEKEAAALRETLVKRSAELENAHGSAEQIRGSLNSEIQSLRLEVEKLSQGGPPISPIVNGVKTPVNGKPNGLLSVATGKRSNRTPKRRSFIDGGDGFGDDMRIGSMAYNPRPASMAFSPAALQKGWMPSPNGDMPMPASENIDSEVRSLTMELTTKQITRILEEDELLNEETTLGLIRSLKIPQPSSQNPVSEREVLFPAHLINLVTSQMWRYGYIKESERFLANVMQTIQQLVMVPSTY